MQDQNRNFAMNMDTDSSMDFITSGIDRLIPFRQDILFPITPCDSGTFPSHSNADLSATQGPFVQGVSTGTGSNPSAFQSGAPGNQSFTTGSFNENAAPANFKFGISQPTTSSTDSPIYFPPAPPKSVFDSPNPGQTTVPTRPELILPSVLSSKAYKLEPSRVWRNPRSWVRNLDRENPDYEFTQADYVAGWELGVKKSMRTLVVLGKCGDSKAEMDAVEEESKGLINQKHFLLKKEHAAWKRDRGLIRDMHNLSRRTKREKRQAAIDRSSHVATIGSVKKPVEVVRKKVHWSKDTNPSESKGKEVVKTYLDIENVGTEMMGKVLERSEPKAKSRRQNKIAKRKAKADWENLQRMMRGLALGSSSMIEEGGMKEGDVPF
ncbi:hypothetical protein B7494_g8299 [Chlorociboria aeruginascens]|nr:hypothetical protein B7494_g8299 [Chlorociboria aeruginascens]